MDEAVAYSTLALTVTLAVTRPRLGARTPRFTPGTAALVGVALLLLAGLLKLEDLLVSARVQWRPLLALTCIMVMTGVVQEVGAFDRLAAWIELHAHRTSARRAFDLVFAASIVTPSLLNNDAAILLLTPVVVALARRLYPRHAGMTDALAFAVFLAPGVAPLVISNPMNMIVAEYAGVGFNAYARVMAPISAVGALLTHAILRGYFRRVLSSAVAEGTTPAMPAARAGERPALLLLVAVLIAYPMMAAMEAPIWVVSLAGALSALALAARYRVASTRAVVRHVSVDILVFLWGVFLLVVGLRHVGLVDRLASVYASSGIATVGVVSAVGSALVDNHPMSLLNMMALGHGEGSKLLAALVGGDIGPRLLPIGSLAGLLWMDLLRRSGVEIPTGTFFRLGALVLVPTLSVSLVLLWALAR